MASVRVDERRQFQRGPTIFRVAPDGTGFQTLHQFVIGGVGLQGRLFEVAPGEFIGTYGSGGGYVFRLSFLPELTSLSPSSATVGSAGFTLTVNGTRFVNGSQVRWNGSPRPTTFVNEGQLQATISASDIATGGTANVTVVNPGPISGPSNALPFAIAPTLALDKTALVFGAVTTGTGFIFQTSAQPVRLTQTGSGSVTWTASSNQPWLKVSPASGSGSATLSIRVAFDAGLPSSGSRTGAITLTVTGAANTPGPIAVRLNRLSGPSAKPQGVVDTPIDHSTGVTGAVPFTGWAIDDVQLARVMICRAPFGAEVAPVDPNCGGAAQIFVGFPVFIDLARARCGSLYPSCHSTRGRAGASWS